MEQDLPITTMSRIKGMIDLRDATYDLIDLQTENYPDENIKVAQNKLNRLYDEYVKKYGRINSRGNKLAFEADSSYYLLCSLEVMDDGKFKRKADMFSKRTINAYKEITNVDTANEALIVSLSEKAKVDLEYINNVVKERKKYGVFVASISILDKDFRVVAASESYEAGHTQLCYVLRLYSLSLLYLLCRYLLQRMY